MSAASLSSLFPSTTSLSAFPAKPGEPRANAEHLRRDIITECIVSCPTLEREADKLIIDSVVLGPKAMALKDKFKELMAHNKVSRRLENFDRAYYGDWAELRNGKKVMVWMFHAFIPPAFGAHDIPRPLIHLGVYNPDNRSLDTTEAPPPLPKNKEDWPWA
jgi:hypothetical protein